MKRESARAVATRPLNIANDIMWRYVWTDQGDGSYVAMGTALKLRNAIARALRKARDDGRGGRR